MTPEVAARTGVLALFRRLTRVGAGVHFATAAMTLARDRRTGTAHPMFGGPREMEAAPMWVASSSSLA